MKALILSVFTSSSFPFSHSMRQLHLHVISQDLCGVSLKKKEHYQRFATPFFISLDEVGAGRHLKCAALGLMLPPRGSKGLGLRWRGEWCTSLASTSAPPAVPA